MDNITTIMVEAEAQQKKDMGQIKEINKKNRQYKKFVEMSEEDRVKWVIKNNDQLMWSNTHMAIDIIATPYLNESIDTVVRIMNEKLGDTVSNVRPIFGDEINFSIMLDKYKLVSMNYKAFSGEVRIFNIEYHEAFVDTMKTLEEKENKKYIDGINTAMPKKWIPGLSFLDKKADLVSIEENYGELIESSKIEAAALVVIANQLIDETFESLEEVHKLTMETFDCKLPKLTIEEREFEVLPVENMIYRDLRDYLKENKK